MASEKPTVYLLRGDDSTRIEELLDKFKTELGTPELSGLNTIVLDGAASTLEEIQSAAFTMPFLTERRLVILKNPIKRAEDRKGQDRKKFLSLLDSLPITTALVLIIEDSITYRRGSVSWEKLNNRHWLMEWIKTAGERVWVEDCSLPTEREMPVWVLNKAKELDGSFEPDAAEKLTEYVGTDTLQASQEIQKLLTYVAYEKPVTLEDVVLLTTQNQEGNIFMLTDALGERNGQKALEQLGILLETNDPLELFGMINRQFRLLLQAREILDEKGGENQIREELNLHAYVAQKLTQQAKRFNLEQLENIYQKLLSIDLDIKSGGMPGDVAFQMLIADLTP